MAKFSTFDIDADPDELVIPFSPTAHKLIHKHMSVMYLSVDRFTMDGRSKVNCAVAITVVVASAVAVSFSSRVFVVVGMCVPSF